MIIEAGFSDFLRFISVSLIQCPAKRAADKCKRRTNEY
jgi:hypothetical protein